MKVEKKQPGKWRVVYNELEGWAHIFNANTKTSTPKKNKVVALTSKKKGLDRIKELGVTLNN